MRSAFFDGGSPVRYHSLASLTFSTPILIAWSELHAMASTGVLAYPSASRESRSHDPKFDISKLIQQHIRTITVFINVIIPGLALALLISNITVLGIATGKIQRTEDLFSSVYQLLTKAASTWKIGDQDNISPEIQSGLRDYVGAALQSGRWLANGFTSQACNIALVIIVYM